MICLTVKNLQKVYNRQIKLRGVQELRLNSNFVENIKVSILERGMKTVSHVVVVILILIKTGKASKREVKIKGDLTERIDAIWRKAWVY